MNLWIRTQDNDLSVVEDIIAPTCYDGKNWHLSAYTCKGRFITLGIYSTEERALDVLNEINDIKFYKYMASLDWDIVNKSLFLTFSDDDREKMLSMMNTYQMPKE